MDQVKTAILEADFLNDFIISHPKKLRLDEDLKQKFLTTAIDPFWHSDKDQLDYFTYYNNGTYYCQRKKLKYDFKENINYWSTYTFTGASLEQAKELSDKIKDLVSVILEVKILKYDLEVEKIDEESIFFDQRYAKKLIEKNEMLAASDWRVLPDVEDSYPGEKDMWIKWRSTLRKETVKPPTDFERGLDFLQYLYQIKWPIDPKIYREKYPNSEVEYLSTDDQWVEYDSLASSDFVSSRIVNLAKIANNYTESYRKVSQSTLNMMKLLDIDEIAPVDWSIYYTDDIDLNLPDNNDTSN